MNNKKNKELWGGGATLEDLREWGSRIMECTSVKVSKAGEQVVSSHARKVSRVAEVE